MSRKTKIGLAILPVALGGCGGATAILLALAPSLIKEADEVHRIKLRVLPSIAEPGAKVRLTVDGYSRIGNEVSIKNELKLWTATGDLDLLRSETPEGQQLLLSGQLHTASNDIELQVKEREAINRPGTVNFTVQVGGRSATASLQVMLSASGLLSLYVQPPTIGLAPGARQQFTVVARDAQGVAVPVDGVVWEATGGLSVDPDGLVTVPSTAAPGTAEVSAKIVENGQESKDTAEVIISSQEPENRVYEVLVYPRSVRLYTGSSLGFLAVAIDHTGVAVPSAKFQWSINKGIATIDPRSGVLTTGTETGELQVTAALTNAQENRAGSASVTIEAKP